MQINRVNKNLNRRYPNKNKTEKKCIRCGKFPAHNRNDYPAINVRCWQCSKIEHYGKFCKKKSEVRELKEDNFLGSITLDKINSVKGVEGLEWQVKIKVTTKVCSKIINFQLDTGVDMTNSWPVFLILQLYGRQIKKLYGPGHKEIQVIGCVEVMLDNRRISTQQDQYVVKNLDEPRMGGPAIKALKILEKINAINNESHRYKKTLSKSIQRPWKIEKRIQNTLGWDISTVFYCHPQKSTTPYEAKSRRRSKTFGKRRYYLSSENTYGLVCSHCCSFEE